jgi:hypothetical protein
VQGDKFSCQNLVTDEIEDYHVTRLREFRYDERYVDPSDIALRDRVSKRSWLIVVILADLRHWPSLLNGGALMNLLSLGNRGAWKNLRETEMLHCYLILHGLQKLIPAKFRERYPELAEGRRRRRQDVAADEVEQVSSVGLESSKTQILGRLIKINMIQFKWCVYPPF